MAAAAMFTTVNRSHTNVSCKGLSCKNIVMAIFTGQPFTVNFVGKQNRWHSLRISVNNIVIPHWLVTTTEPLSPRLDQTLP